MAAEKSSTSPMIAESDFVITRVIDAPRAVVFNAWTEPKQLARWWGPHGMINPVCEVDARTGGAYRITMRAATGEEYPIRGTLQEVKRPERLVMTMDCSEHPPSWHDMVNPNRGKNETNPAGIMVTTVTFEDLGGKTKLTIRTRFDSPIIAETMKKMGMNDGWSQSLERLSTVVGATPASAPPTDGLVIQRTINAPRDLVFKAWIDPEQLAQWYAPNGCSVEFRSIEPRQGGTFHLCIRTPNGRDCWVTGVYIQIAPPGRLVYTMANADKHGNNISPVDAGLDPDWPAQTVVTVTFTEQGGKTTITLHQTADEALAKRTGAHPSWLQMLDRLATLVS